MVNGSVDEVVRVCRDEYLTWLLSEMVDELSLKPRVKAGLRLLKKEHGIDWHCQHGRNNRHDLCDTLTKIIKPTRQTPFLNVDEITSEERIP